MKKLVLLVAFVATASVFSSCTSYTCPTYSQVDTQQAPTQLNQENL